MLQVASHSHDYGGTCQRRNGPPSGRLNQSPLPRLPHVNWRGGLCIPQIISTVLKAGISGFSRLAYVAIT